MKAMAIHIMHKCHMHSKDLPLLVILFQAIERSMACPCGNLSVYT